MKTRFFVILTLPFLLTVSLFAISENDLNKVIFSNNLENGKTIEYIFFSPNDSAYWGPDILDKQNKIVSGKTVEYYVFYPDESGFFDFLAVDSDGIIYEVDKIQITDGQSTTVKFMEKNKTERKIDGLNLTEIIFSNATNKELSYLFLAPADSKMWGVELLNTNRTMAPGATISVLVLLAGEKFDMDFLAIDSESSSYEKTVSIGTEEDTLYQTIDQTDVNNEE